MRIADNPAGGPFLKGCVRGYRAFLQQQAPDRLTAPLVRTGQRGSGQFREAGWDEALGLVADGLASVRDRYGNDAVVALSGSGSCRGALHDTGALTARFLNLTGGHVEESNTYSSAADSYVEPVVLGTRKAGVDPATMRHAGMIVLWGANLVDCIMGCEWRARVRQAKRRGVPVIVDRPAPHRDGEAARDGVAAGAARHRQRSHAGRAVRADHRGSGGRGVRRRARDGLGGAAPAGAGEEGAPGEAAGAPGLGAGDDAGVGRGRVRHAGGAHRRAGARLGAPPPHRARPRPLDPAHVGRGRGRASRHRPAGRDRQPGPPRRLVGSAHLGRPSRAALRGHPRAAEPRRRERRRERLGRRGPQGARRRLPGRHPRGRQRGRQLRRPGRRRAQEHPRHGGARVLRLPRAVPDRDRAALRRRPARHPLAGAQRRPVHECKLPPVLAQGGGRARAGARRLRRLRRPRRAHGCRRAVH